MNVSYQRNRDYSKNLDWTYGLNSDVYECYKRAKCDPTIGYMKRLKLYWDELHPEYYHLNEKQLRQQATFVEKKKLVLDSNLETGIRKEWAENLIDQVNQNNIENSTENSQNIPDVENIIDENLFNNIKSRFSEHYNKYHGLPVNLREYNPYNIPTEEFDAVSKVITEHFEVHVPVNLWNFNVTQYAAIITLLERRNLLKERKNVTNNVKPKSPWLKFGEEKIGNLQRQIAHINTILNRRKNNTQLTKNQLKIQQRLKRKCGNTNTCTLSSKQCLLKHELHGATIKERKSIEERNEINKTFKNNRKLLYQNWKSKKIEVKDPPPIDEIQNFWGSTWGNDEEKFNENAKWLNTLRKTYCANAMKKRYEMTFETFDQVLKNTKNNGAPSNDLIKCFWIKKLSSTHVPLFNQLKRMFDGEIEMGNWLPLCRTILIPKDVDTRNKAKYRPIACLNITYKLYTGMLYTFVEDHCSSNNIITTGQAGGKKGSWGCVNQLLTNKMILEEEVKHRRNIFTMWFDYKKRLT